MEILLTRYEWLKLSNEQRLLMREVFNIPRSSGVEMMGNVMKSDGSNENDLRAVNVTTMQNFLDASSTGDTFQSLYEATINKINQMIEDKKEIMEDQLEREMISSNIDIARNNMLSIIDMYNRLSPEGKAMVRAELNLESKKTAEKNINKINEYSNVQENTSTKINEEVSNEQAAESPRKRGRPAKRLG